MPTTEEPPRVISTAQFGDIVLSHSSATRDPREPRSAQDEAKVIAVKRVSVQRVGALQDAGYTGEDPLQELQVAAKISAAGDHDHVVKYLSSYIEGDYLCLVMEFCNEGDLLSHFESRLEQDGGSSAMSEREALEIVSQVAQALSFLHHTVGVAHRDVSLENVFVHKGACKLGDFGLSVSASERPCDSVGKLAYMAPEVVAGLRYDPCAADVWSLGILLFILLTNSPLVEVASMENAPFRAFCRLGVRQVLGKWGMLGRVERLETLDLCNAMLQVEPEKRISIQGVLSHPALAARKLSK